MQPKTGKAPTRKLCANENVTKTARVVPLRVVAKWGSKAAQRFANVAAPIAEVLAPGFTVDPANDLVFRGGRTIQDLSFINFYIAGQTAWAPSDMQNIDQALAAAMSDQGLNNVMMQYFNNQPITSRLISSNPLPGNAPAVVSQGDAEALVISLSKQGALDGVDLSSTVVNLLLPPGTVLTTDEGVTGNQLLPRTALAEAAGKQVVPADDKDSSRVGLGGYHGSVHLTMSGVGTTIYYAIGVFSQVGADGVENGIVAFPEPWKNVVATFYHELNEARTDPDVEDQIRTGDDSVLGWISNSRTSRTFVTCSQP